MNTIELESNPNGAASRLSSGEHSAAAGGYHAKIPARRPAGRRAAAGVAAAALLVAGLALGFVPRWRERRETVADMQQLDEPAVTVVAPTLEKPDNGLVLPAEIRPWREAAIYARASGFLKDWAADIGAHVASGQLLAEIETPDLDQQLDQAKAQVALARANLHLAETTDTRWQQLLKSASVSEQEADEKTAAREAAAASLAADQANMNRLRELVSFERIVAPFAGIVTARSVDMGDLIVTGGASRELFHMAQVEKLRVYIRVPEAYGLDIAPGQMATLTTPASPGRVFPARVVTTSEAISTASRTLLTELEVDNSQNRILPNSFGEVSLKVANSDPVLTLPSNSILFRAQGLQVAVARPDRTVEMRPVKTGRDFGQTIEILGGVTPADRVIVNPTDALVSGAKVRVQGAPGTLAAN